MASRFAQSVFDLKTSVAQRSVRAADAGLRESEHWPVERLRDLQLSQGMELARHAFTTTEYYRNLYTDAGLQLGDLSEAANWVHLPLTDKAAVRAHGPEMASAGSRPRDVLISRTGGSTGVPLEVHNDRRSPAAAMWWRAYRWWGVSPADNRAYIYRQSRNRKQELRHRLQWWPTRSLLLNARGMTVDSMRGFVSSWRKVRPRLLNGYVDAIHEFARFVQDEKIDLPRVEAIAVTSSMIQPSQREFIESVLQAPVYDCYRTAEVPWLAAQCAAQTGLHVMADLRLLELVDDEQHSLPVGTSGEVVVTDLRNRVFPLIRYRLGDRSRLLAETCPCGKTLPLMEPVHGRLVDVLHSPRGHRITGGLGGLFNRWPSAVQKFQIHQHADFHVTVRYVPGESAEAAREAAQMVSKEISTMLGGTVPVSCEPAASIGHDGGKIRLVVSEVGVSA